MGDVQGAKSYLLEAFEDYNAANLLLDNQQYKKATFHIQQCVEKTLKSLAYYSTNDPVPYDVSHTHVIPVILEFDRNHIGYDETLLPSNLFFYMDVLGEWETKGRYPGNGHRNWTPDQDDMQDMYDIMDILPNWMDEVQYVVDQME